MKEKLCPMCSGVMENSSTCFTVDYKDGVIVIRDVPADKCKQCGEEFIADNIVSKLEEIVALVKSQKQEVFIAKFSSFSIG